MVPSTGLAMAAFSDQPPPKHKRRQFARRARLRLQPIEPGNQRQGCGGGVDRLHQRHRAISVGRGLAIVEIDGQRRVAFFGKSGGDAADLIVQTPPFVDENDAAGWQRTGRCGERGADRSSVRQREAHRPCRRGGRPRPLGIGKHGGKGGSGQTAAKERAPRRRPIRHGDILALSTGHPRVCSEIGRARNERARSR
jgi:hypothetical protein